MSVLVIADHDHSNLSGASFNTVTAALAIEDSYDVLVLGHNCQSVADQAAKLPNVKTVFQADDAQFAHFLAEDMVASSLELAQKYSYVLFSATTTGKNIAPRLAALADVAMLSDITAVIDAETFERPIYAGNAIATVKSSDSLKVITVRSTAFDACAAEGGSGSIETLAAASSTGLTEFKSQELSKSERPELTAAKVIISGGRGMQSGDNFEMLEKVADKLGAAVGASRAAVDAGYVPNDYQVGQTGKIVAPDLYIAVGISGAIQHLAGMKDSKVIVAINKDEEAPIFQVADYGLVADLFSAIPELEEKL